jgi:hypothetical protein
MSMLLTDDRDLVVDRENGVQHGGRLVEQIARRAAIPRSSLLGVVDDGLVADLGRTAHVEATCAAVVIA